jgi:hypothetical protein
MAGTAREVSEVLLEVADTTREVAKVLLGLVIEVAGMLL